MTSLVEAKRDGRLGAREAASLERHLETCAECRRLSNDLETLGEWARRSDPAMPQLDHRRARGALLQRAARAPDAAAKPRQPVLWLAFAACGISAALLGITLRQPHPEKIVMAPPLHVELPTSNERTATVLVPDSGATFAREERGSVDSVALADGGVTFRVRHLADGERFIVRTDDATIEVRGTIFRVEAEHGRIRRVSVSEGRVEVAFEHADVFVGAGESWTPPFVADADPAAKSHSELPRSVTPTTSAAPASSAAPPVSSSSPASPSVSPSASAATHNEALARAEAALARGDDAAAVKDLLPVASTPSPDEDSAFLLVVALERAGRHAEAGEAARRYLKLFPNGFRRAEAQVIAGAP
jgi:hypothetical protein